MGYERSIIAAMRGYVPGKQLASRDIIKLNSNENPHPPCPAVMHALRDIDPEALRRYPPAAADGFRDAAAALHGLSLDQVVAVNGGDELLRMVITTFVDPGSPIGVVEPSYSLYPVLAAIHGSAIVALDSMADWSLPRDLATRMNDAGVKLLFVVNPHAPSGHLTAPAALAELARAFRGVLLVDEAYVDFVDPALGHDVVPLLAHHDNVLILRSMSKGYSLAGLRFGYGLGAKELIEPLLWKTRDSYNVDAIAQHLATTALQHRGEAEKTWAAVREERARTGIALHALGFEVYPSQSNFLLARVPAGTSAAALLRSLEARGILVRHFAEPRLDDALRISIGTHEQNHRLLAELGTLLRA
jgi:histidinol-phosphate aminotransferase